MKDNVGITENEFSSFKILNHLDRLGELADTGDCYPVTVELDLTNFCNHNCKCCIDPSHGKTVMEVDFIETLLGELSHLGIKAVVLKGGGESIIHPDYEEIVALIKSRGFDLGTVTNGSRLIEDSISQALAEHADYVRISFNGPTRETFREMHGVDKFDEIKEGVKKLVGLRGGKYPVVGISFPFDIHSIDLAEHAIALVDELDADYVLVRPFFYEEVGYERNMDPEQAAEVRKRLIDSAAKYQGDKIVQVGQFVSDYEYDQQRRSDRLSNSGRRAVSLIKNNGIEHTCERCYAHPLITAVTADGNVWGCPNLRNQTDFCYGRINYQKGDSFETLWHGARRRKARTLVDRARCLKYCTHALSRYNEMLYYLKECDKAHGSFL